LRKRLKEARKAGESKRRKKEEKNSLEGVKTRKWIEEVAIALVASRKRDCKQFV